MGARRFGPLILLLLLGTVVIAARLYQVQIVEHDIWQSEAKNLVRRGAMVPYRRGEFLDAAGRRLVRDEDVYRVDFSYRDFRRGHPLGQVAHAWASLTLRPVPLGEVWDDLEGMARELVQLTDEELDFFVAGETGLIGEFLWVPAIDPDVPEYRGSRRSDVRYYITQLLQLDRSQALRAARSETAHSLIEFAVEARGFEDREALLADLDERLAGARRDLHELAEELMRHERKLSDAPPVRDGVGAMQQLVERLEEWRVQVEDETAGELFREATGFSAGRVEPDLLLAYFDLRWLEVLLRWDPERTARWVEGARAARLRSFESWSLPRMLIKVELAEHPGDAAVLVAAHWRALYAGGRGVVAFDELDSLFDLRIPRGRRAKSLEVLPVRVPARGASDFEQLAALELWRPGEPAPPTEVLEQAAEMWREKLTEGGSGRLDREWFRERCLTTLTRWEGWFQEALGNQLAGLDEIEPGIALALAAGRLDRAEERARSVLKDRGSRSMEVARKPDYDLIHLLTRYPEHFAGFVVRDWTERLQLRDERGVPVAGGLIGTVQTQGLREVISQRELRRELAVLLHQGSRNSDQEQRLAGLVRDVARLDELMGGDGLEGYYERELTGHNGYREQRGLQQVVEGAGPGDLMDLRPIDGKTVQLTLDIDLQRAALEALMHPGEDPNDDRRDYDWLTRPTGAIVLCRPNGDVLAAASFPDQDRDGRMLRGGRDPRDLGLERTLRIPTFQPPGSVFKPFVAAWALEHAGLDVNQTMVCGPIASGGCGFDTLHCHARYGHGELSLHEALKRSCNGYFAWVGKGFTQQDFQGLAAEFGFGQPTGVRPDRERGGLYEEFKPDLFKGPLLPRQFLMAANGLAVVETSPMQLARAYCGIATGRLPDMRLVDRVDGVAVERSGRPLQLSPGVLAVIQRALFDVANAPGGSAETALNSSRLGFALSGKTGSADLTSERFAAPDGTLRVRKHTWFAGWFPPQDPVAVVVVFVNNTIETSSHTSIWVANKFLRSPEVATFIEREVPR